MIGIFANAGAVMFGTAIGVIVRHFLTERYKNALWMVLGFAALCVGMQTVVATLPKSHYPVLFIISMAIGFPIGTALQLDERSNRWLNSHFSTKIGEGIATATFLDCIGALAILGPVYAATSGNQTMLYTNAMFTLVCAIIFGAGFGWGMLLETPLIFGWLLIIYLIAKFLSASFFSPAFITEMSIVGGILIIAAGLSLLKIREFKTVDMLPALIVPVIFFIILRLI
ncbi:DUF554 domain-containing protein [Limosilactobacillus caecicola]|uniref:DUF554 domain-containing protein n=1 Tax=Limosilactobacillus caecicola TaxID=2941332 RepID=UPI00203E2444|nr:DUF554 domain-containing protein [Limosilactobacillus caecicola]